MTQEELLIRKAAELGELVVRMTALAGSGHPSSALSLAHVVAHLVYREMSFDPADPWNPRADRLVLSEGHAVPIVYAAWADLNGAIGCSPSGCACAGRLSRDDLDALRERGSVLDGHPNPAEGFPFFDAATGSLGQGLSIAAGLALAARLDESPRRVYVIIGDGESREGQVWEAADFVADYGLNNVCAVFNCNGQGQAGPVSAQQSPERIAAKLRAFGWDATIIDGHDAAALADALAGVGESGAPRALVARTVKGWGVPALQQGNWHGKPLKPDELDGALRELRRIAGGRAGAEEPGGALRPAAPRPGKPPVRPDPREATWPTFAEAMRAAGFGGALEKGRLATRRAYGVALKVAGDLLPNVVCLDGDVSNSTFSEIFKAAHPRRFFECKIAEQNMLSVAVGLSAGGYIPFVNSFAKFISRAYDQFEMASISRANVKIVGSHAGVTPAADGPSQMALPDVAYFRAFTTVRGDDRTGPVCRVYQPADAVSAFACTRLMLAERGLAYMRTLRPDTPILYDEQTRFEPGGIQTIGSGTDAAIVASAYMVHVALRAAELLARQGIRVTVVDAYTLPIDAERLLEALRGAGGRALTVEDNYGGGMGSAVAEIAARAGGLRVATLHAQRIPKSTRTEEEALDYVGVGAPQIADHVRGLLGTG